MPRESRLGASTNSRDCERGGHWRLECGGNHSVDMEGKPFSGRTLRDLASGTLYEDCRGTAGDAPGDGSIG